MNSYVQPLVRGGFTRVLKPDPNLETTAVLNRSRAALLTMLCAIILSGSMSGCGAGTASTVPDLASAVYRFEVFTADGQGTAAISYVKDDHTAMEEVIGANLPWSTEVSMAGLSYKPLLTLSAYGSTSGIDTITCRISQGGKVLAESTSTGRGATVICMD